MAVFLSETEVIRAAKILSEDLSAVEKKLQIYGLLGAPQSELPQLTENVHVYNSGAYGFFVGCLTKYVSMKGSEATLNCVINKLRELNLVSVIEKLEMKPMPETGIWFEVDSPVESFSGRERELEELHKLITQNTGKVTVINQIATVAGLGGVGKSELARKYSWDNYEYYGGNVIWFNAEFEDPLRRSLIRLLVKELKIPQDECERKKEAELLKIVYKYFGSRGRCLIVFDNVEDFDILKFVPKSPESPTAKIPNILITSRKCVWRTGIKTLELDVWTLEEAVQFVNEFVGRSLNQEDVAHLVNTLQRLPLALQQAVAFIRAELSEDLSPVQKYIQLFQNDNTQQLLEYINDDLSEHEKTTFKIWTVTLGRIEDKAVIGALGIRIMNIISFLEPDNIPGKIFHNQFMLPNSNLMSTIDSTIKDLTENSFLNENAVNQAISLLKSFSMISGEPGVINVHRLVQKVVGLSISEKERAIGDGLTLLDRKVKGESDSEFAHSLLGHAGTLWGHARAFPELVSKYEDFPSTINWQLESKLESKYRSAEDCFKLKSHSDSLKILKEIYPLAIAEFGPIHFITRATCTLISKNLRELNNDRETLKVLDDMIEVTMRKFSQEHGKTMFAINNKAETLRSLGKLDEAIEVYRSIYERQKRLGGEDDSGALKTLREIASILEEKGDLDGSLEVYKKVEVYNRSIDFIQDKAALLLRIGNLDEALEIYKHLHNEAKKSRSSSTRVSAISASFNLASLLEKKENYEEAILIYEYISETIIMKLNPWNAMNLRALEHRAAILIQLGRFDEALKDLRYVFEARSEDDEGYTILNTLSSIGHVLFKKEEYAEALSTYQSVYNELVNSNKLEDPEALEILEKIRQCQSKLQQALKTPV